MKEAEGPIGRKVGECQRGAAALASSVDEQESLAVKRVVAVVVETLRQEVVEGQRSGAAHRRSGMGLGGSDDELPNLLTMVGDLLVIVGEGPQRPLHVILGFF